MKGERRRKKITEKFLRKKRRKKKRKKRREKGKGERSSVKMEEEVEWEVEWNGGEWEVGGVAKQNHLEKKKCENGGLSNACKGCMEGWVGGEMNQ